MQGVRSRSREEWLRFMLWGLFRTRSWPPPLHSRSAPTRKSSVQALSVNDDDERDSGAEGLGCTVLGYGFGFYHQLDVGPRHYT